MRRPLGGTVRRTVDPSMTVKYLHVRAVDEVGEFLACGGVTVAYVTTTIKDMEYIYLQVVKCRPTELFCYRTGREEAKKLLEKEGPYEILDLNHPISCEIVDWLANSLWPQGSEAMGYVGDDMGFAIDISQDEKGRWCSTFEPSQSSLDDVIDFKPELLQEEVRP